MCSTTPVTSLTKSFLNYLAHERRYSAKTILAYRLDLRQFTQFVFNTFQESNPEQAHYHMIREWIVHLMSAKIAARSINRKVTCLRSFYKFCTKTTTVNHDPTQHIKRLKVPQKLPQFVKEGELNSLFDQCHFEDTFEGWRDRLILELLYATGIRRDELIGLKERYVNHREYTIKVWGKRNKERVIPFPRPLMNVITSYRTKRDEEGIPNTCDNFLVTNKGMPLYPMMVYRTVNNYLKQTVTVGQASPHVLRHTFATHLLNRGAEINAVKDLLGHSSLAATQVYTHNSIDRLKKVFDLAHPKA